MTVTLNDYLKRSLHLLREERQDLINPQDFIDYINIARGQVAGEAECIRKIGTITTAANTMQYNFAAINLGTPATTGIQSAINVRRINYNLGQGARWIPPRAWEYFDLYHLNNPVPVAGPPEVWAQYAQGVSGSFYIDPPPDGIYTLNLDCVCYPINMTNNATVEALPYLWSDAVPYFAAYLAFLALFQNDKADKMFEYYTRFVQRARQFANPSVNRTQYEQATDPASINKLGVQTRGS